MINDPTDGLYGQSVLSNQLEEAMQCLEDMARQHCHCDKRESADEPLITDSGAITANAEALELLEKYGKFRIARGIGRMVLGYWPENDPEKKSGHGAT